MVSKQATGKVSQATGKVSQVAGKVKETAKTAGATTAAGTAAAARATGGVTGAVPGVTPTDQLRDSLRKLAGTVATRTAASLAGKITSASGRLTEYAEGGGGGLISALTGGEPGAKRKAALGMVTGGLKGALSGITENVKQKVKDLVGGIGGGEGDLTEVTNIVEQIDVGVPVDLAYDQWTRFTDFPTFMKKVEKVEQLGDEKVRWTAQIFLSHRTWESTIVEQVPYERIVWRSEGRKGYVDGAVTFHEVTPDLTRVMAALEYHPRGLFEKTGNIWRAQGRRARLELKHFRRHVMAHAILHPDEIEGWHGEIQDGKVVSTGDGERPTAEGEEPEEAAEEAPAEPGEEAGEEFEEEEAAEAPPSRRQARTGASGRQ